MTPRITSGLIWPAAALILAAAIGPGLRASSPVIWEHPAGRAREDSPPLQGAPAPPSTFVDGEVFDGVSMGHSGILSLSAPLREIFPAESKFTPPPLLWSAALDPGGNLFIGAGNTGQVFRIDRKGVASLVFDAEELGVRAVAPGGRGDVYIATFPNGGIYRLPAEGDAEPWFEAEDRYLWAMTIDRAERLHVATGERGIIYSVTGKAEGTIAFDTDEAHVTALALDQDGSLLAGTDPDGLLYRIGPDGRISVLLDSDLREIPAVAVGPGGVLYAAAIGEEPARPVLKAGERNDLKIEVTPAVDGGVLEESTDLPRKITIDLADLLPAPSGQARGASGRIYRLEPGRAPVVVWKSDTERVYSLAYHGDRGLVFGTGGAGAEGRLYRLEEDGTSTLLHRLKEAQVTVLSAAPDGRLYACTSNPGRVYVLDIGSVAAGSYRSAVHDAGRLADWGTVSWQADVPSGTRIEVSTRSGNRPVPDETWSPWSPAYAQPGGSGIANPPGRYLQWKADLSRLKTEAVPRLRKVSISLLPRNLPPELDGLSVLACGEATRKPPAIPALPIPSANAAAGPAPAAARPESPGALLPRGHRWVLWTATDPDGDRLAHTIRIRKSGDSEFREIERGVESSPYALDDSKLEEGRHELLVDATDAPTNGPERARLASSAPVEFLVDHTPPTLDAARPEGFAPTESRYVVEVRARDRSSPIARGEYAVAAPGDPARVWVPLPCRDGICDTPSESFLLDLPPQDAGHRIEVRVFDAAGNEATMEAPSSPR
ncbi:MAG TPA: hypothetical protein VFP98_02050 [Candidatus Polarisedimenticolia bacterium]|nr:hypothetical protein [Candidatus Polarisedimenticolia bacterium]